MQKYFDFMQCEQTLFQRSAIINQEFRIEFDWVAFEWLVMTKKNMRNANYARTHHA